MKKKVILWALILVIAIAISFLFDAEIVLGVSHLRNFLFDDFFLGLTFISSEIIIFFVLTILFLWRDKKRKFILPLWLTLFLSAVVSFVLKILIKRPRPFQMDLVSVLPVLEKASHAIWNFSFPSFQAMLVFCSIPIISKEFPRFKYVWVILACLVAFSRVYFGLHFLSDVIAGGAIGYLIGVLVIRKENFWGGVYKKSLGKFFC